MLYMFLLYWDPANPTPDALEKHLAFTAAARERGAYIHSEAIGSGEAATTVRLRDGKVTLTDGPFVESKEVVGGYYLLDCKDLDEALEYAAQIPDAGSGGVEVRPVMDVPGWDYGPLGKYKRQPMG